MQLIRIVSGGQTGADLAALDVALDLGIPCGGWVPAGRINEDGLIPAHYPDLKETPSSDPRFRTEWNVENADATVIFSHGALRGGSLYTRIKALEHGKPTRHIDFERVGAREAVALLRHWLSGKSRVHVLNIAGPRASEDPDIYEKTRWVLGELLKPVLERPPS